MSSELPLGERWAAASSSIRRLYEAAATVWRLHEDFEPIYRHYVPKNPLLTVGRLFRITPQVDYEKFRERLQQLRDKAWATVEEANKAGVELRDLDLGPQAVEFARAAVATTYHAGNVIILMNEWTEALRTRDREGAHYFPAVLQSLRDADVSRKYLVAAGIELTRVVESL